MTPLCEMMFNYQKNRPWLENLSIVMQLGLTMAGCILFCFFLGYYVDRWLGTRGIFIAIFTVMGVVGGAVVVYRQIMEALIDKDRKNRPENGNH